MLRKIFDLRGDRATDGPRSVSHARHVLGGHRAATLCAGARWSPLSPPSLRPQRRHADRPEYVPLWLRCTVAMRGWSRVRGPRSGSVPGADASQRSIAGFDPDSERELCPAFAPAALKFAKSRYQSDREPYCLQFVFSDRKKIVEEHRRRLHREVFQRSVVSRDQLTKQAMILASDLEQLLRGDGLGKRVNPRRSQKRQVMFARFPARSRSPSALKIRSAT